MRIVIFKSPAQLFLQEWKEDESAPEHTWRDPWSHFAYLVHASMASEFLLSNTLTGVELCASSCLPYPRLLLCQVSLPAPMIMAWQTSPQISFSWADVAVDLSRVSTASRPLTVSLAHYYIIGPLVGYQLIPKPWKKLLD